MVRIVAIIPIRENREYLIEQVILIDFHGSGGHRFVLVYITGMVQGNLKCIATVG
jgi:hypothetical protein